MNEKAKAFIELAKNDPELAERLTKMAVEEFVAAAQAKGIDLAAEDFAPAEGELDEAEQENLAGGGGCCCALVGGGGGTDAYDDHTYGCACVFMGQGGDGNIKDVNCYCPASGLGNDTGIFLV